jgi:hypothetical protein
MAPSLRARLQLYKLLMAKENMRAISAFEKRPPLSFLFGRPLLLALSRLRPDVHVPPVDRLLLRCPGLRLVVRLAHFGGFSPKSLSAGTVKKCHPIQPSAKASSLAKTFDLIGRAALPSP